MSYHQWQPKPLFDENNPDPRDITDCIPTGDHEIVYTENATYIKSNASTILQDNWTVDMRKTEDMVKNSVIHKGHEWGSGRTLRMKRYDPILSGHMPAELNRQLSAKLLNVPVPNLIHKLSALKVPLAERLENLEVPVVQEERVCKYVFKKDRKVSNYYANDDWKDGIPPVLLRRMVGDIWIDVQTGRKYTLYR